MEEREIIRNVIRKKNDYVFVGRGKENDVYIKRSELVDALNDCGEKILGIDIDAKYLTYKLTPDIPKWSELRTILGRKEYEVLEEILHRSAKFSASLSAEERNIVCKLLGKNNEELLIDIILEDAARMNLEPEEMADVVMNAPSHYWTPGIVRGTHKDIGIFFKEYVLENIGLHHHTERNRIRDAVVAYCNIPKIVQSILEDHKGTMLKTKKGKVIVYVAGQKER